MYTPLELGTAIDVCAELLDLFEANGVKVIRVGMQPGPDGFGRAAAGPRHTSLRELVEANRTLKRLRSMLDGVKPKTHVTILCASADQTRTRGPLNQHIRTLRADYKLAEVSIAVADHLERETGNFKYSRYAMSDFRCGAVAIIGRPNAGKSTLLNRLLGAKLAITSAKAQTTRHRIAGILTESTYQAILLDTPGIHEAWTELNKQMVSKAHAVLDEADTIVWVFDAIDVARRAQNSQTLFTKNEEEMFALLRKHDKPLLVVPNKLDKFAPPLLLPIIEALHTQLTIHSVVPVSALEGDGVDALLEELVATLPVGPMLYPPDEWAQVTERFLVEEIVREKVFQLTKREIPYSTIIEVRAFDETERAADNRVKIFADIIVERDSQKGIIIGKKGEMLKTIGSRARVEIAEMLDCRVHLQLHVKVEKDWSRTRKGLRKVGFSTD